MSVRIRLARYGKKKSPFYRVVIQDSKVSRDGKTIDLLGYYNPVQEPKVVKIEEEKAKQWLSKGAKPTEAVERIFENIGLLPKKDRGNTPKKTKEQKAEEKKA